MNVTDAVSATLQDWAQAEIARIRRPNLRRVKLERQLHAFAAGRRDIRLYRFAEGAVTELPVPPHIPPNESQDFRAAHYLQFFHAVADILPPSISTTICLGVEDLLYPPFILPIFGFQRAVTDPTPLLPDIDFLYNHFYENPPFQDLVPYADKATGAVFAGSTTGGQIDLDAARHFRLPRLRAAHFFRQVPDVDFRLPSVVQCTPDARAFLQAQSFCQAPPASWPEQFRARFLISMDGNGATCSRVAVALGSRCVLLKYDSEHVLYYFQGLTPHVHFIPITQDEDVLRIIETEHADPEHFADIPKAARVFAASFLTRPRIVEYAARLIAAYAAMLDESFDVPSQVPVRGMEVFARGDDGTVLQADEDGWTGATNAGGKLHALRLVVRPPSGASRILAQAGLDHGGFTPTCREGKWCEGEAGRGITAFTIETAPGATPLAFIMEARFTDGSTARSDTPGIACRSPTGAPMQSIRVRLA